MKIVTIENSTPLLPIIIADSVCQEAAYFLKSDTPLSYANSLADRAEACFARNRSFAKLLKRTAARDSLAAFMRHWLSAELKRDAPPLFRQLPTSFLNGAPLVLS